MELNLTNKIVVITGGAAGIGAAAAEEFLREGTVCAVCGRDKEKLFRFKNAERQKAYSARIFASVADVADEVQMRKFAQQVFEQYGRIDIWINNAGIAIDKPFMEFTEEEWDRIQNINLKGVWNCCRIAAEYMMKQESGVIINISSYAAKIPHAGGAVYAASKAGVSSLTKTLEAELAPWNIRVVGVIPGMIRTGISEENIRKNGKKFVQNIAMKRLGVPEDLAKPIVFLASEAAQYIAGFDLEITGGKYAAQNTDWAWEEKPVSVK